MISGLELVGNYREARRGEVRVSVSAFDSRARVSSENGTGGVRTEVFHQPLDRPRCSIAQSANRLAFHLFTARAEASG